MTKRSASYTDLENSLQEIISPSGALLETRWVSKLIELMTESSDLQCRSLLIKVLLNTNQNEKALFSRFVQLGGIEILGVWIEESKLSSEQDSKQLVQSILSSLNKLTITKEVFSKTNIGSILNSLKSSPDTSIQVKASSILSRWEKMSSDEDIAYRPREIKQEMNKKIKADEVPIIPIEPENNKKALRWASEDSIEVSKYFWRTDEPNAQCASLRPMPDSVDSAICVTTVEDFRKKESQMEKELNRKEKSREDSIRYILENMTPKVLYSTPVSNPHSEIATPKAVKIKNLQTPEMIEESKRQQNSFRVAYQRESDIPRVPNENVSFCYADLVYIPSQKQTIKSDTQASQLLQLGSMQGVIPGNVMDPNYLNMMMTPSLSMPIYMPKIMNPNSRPINFRTEACKNFHSAAGCTHGDACHFIHDFTYEGRPIPNMAEWRKNNNIRSKNIETMKSVQMGYPMYYPPATEPHLR